MRRMYTLTELAAELERQNAAKVDYLAPTDQIHFVSRITGVGTVLAETPGTPGPVSEIDLIGTEASGLRVNDVAHSQFADRLKIPKRFYDRLRVEMPTLLDENVNRLLRHHPDRPADKWMIRTLDGVARACLSDVYRRLDNYDIAQTVLPILAEIPEVQFPSCALTDSRLYIKAVTPRLTGQVKVGQDVRAGVYIANSEVGHGSLVVYPFVETLQCTNGMVVQRQGEGMMRQIHLGRRVEADGVGRIFRDETIAADDAAFMMAVGDVVRASVDEVRFRDLVADMARAARDEPVVDVTAAVEVLARREGLSQEEGRGILQHLAAGGDLSRWGMLSAVTRHAEDQESYDRATDLEMLGGKILDYSARQWREVATATA